MRVLNDGKPKKIRWSYKITCTGEKGYVPEGTVPCFTRYKIEIGDIVTKGNDDYFFICPKCHTMTRLCNPYPVVREELKALIKKI